MVITAGNLSALRDGDRTVIFDSDTLAVYVADPALASLSDDAIQSALAAGSSEPIDLAPPKRHLSRTFLPILDETKPVRSGLGRFTLNIANSCNLWCSYCYADHGMYHSEQSLMSPERAVAATAKTLDLYGTVETVHFFGGEPFLNPDAIASVCDWYPSEIKQPEFVATTNGTILNTRLEELLLEHEISLTMSVDGPPEIHNELRPTRAEASSHEQIQSNFTRLIDLGITVDIECTYTMAHYMAGISVPDLLDYFEAEFGTRTPHISWAYLPEPKTASTLVSSGRSGIKVFRDDIEDQARQHLNPDIAVELFREGARHSVKNLRSGQGAVLTSVLGMVRRIADRSPAQSYCPAFSSQLSIATNGDAFPCFMFIGDSDFVLGNIFDDSFPNENASRVWQRYANEFGPTPTGDDIWCAPLLAGCVAGDYIATDTLQTRLYQPVYEAMVEEVVIGLAGQLGDNQNHVESERLDLERVRS